LLAEKSNIKTKKHHKRSFDFAQDDNNIFVTLSPNHMLDYLQTKLNAEQFAAATHIDTSSLILAGA
jgi:hypothetical protein